MDQNVLIILCVYLTQADHLVKAQTYNGMIDAVYTRR